MRAIISKETFININNKSYLLEPGDRITINEASVRRCYLKITHNNEDQYYTPASANDNYIIRFLERLFNSRKFKNGSYKAQIVTKIPAGYKKKSLETFLKELIPDQGE